MDALSIINKYYPKNDELRHILLFHSRQVADKALLIAKIHPELCLDKRFLEEAAMLHDIGIFLTDAPGIQCFGTSPYICHGYLGADLIRQEGFPRHALVCERHTGAGLSLFEIESRRLPVPHRDMIPISEEEQVICFADKFYSKSNLEKEKTVEKALKSIEKYGKEGILRFQTWCERYL
jgi:uncharacterized protein